MDTTVQEWHNSGNRTENTNEEQESPNIVDNMVYGDDSYMTINAQDKDDGDHNTANIFIDHLSTSSQHDTDDDFIMTDVDHHILDAMEVDHAEWETYEANAGTSGSNDIIDLTTDKPLTPATNAETRGNSNDFRSFSMDLNPPTSNPAPLRYYHNNFPSTNSGNINNDDINNMDGTEDIEEIDITTETENVVI